MRMWVGTSGYNYPNGRAASIRTSSRRPRCCPTTPSASQPSRSTTPSYRIPNEKILAGWDRETPPGFRLTLKAPSASRTSRDSRTAQTCCSTFSERGHPGAEARRDPLQLPPYFAATRGARSGFCSCSPPAPARRSSSACLVDGPGSVRSAAGEESRPVHRRQPEKFSTPASSPPTTAISACVTRVTRPRTLRAGADHPDPGCRMRRRVRIYFKHEEAGIGPQFARLLLDALPSTSA